MFQDNNIKNEFWRDRDNQTQFFIWLFDTLGYKCMDDWYKITLSDIYKNGGKKLLSEIFNGSPSNALQSIYPEHNWVVWKFLNIPKHGYWDSPQNCRNFFDWIGSQTFKENS